MDLCCPLQSPFRLLINCVINVEINEACGFNVVFYSPQFKKKWCNFILLNISECSRLHTSLFFNYALSWLFLGNTVEWFSVVFFTILNSTTKVVLFFDWFTLSRLKSPVEPTILPREMDFSFSKGIMWSERIGRNLNFANRFRFPCF